MSETSVDPRSLRAPPKRPIKLSWSDERVRGIVWQILVVGIVAAIVWWLWSNTVHNLEVRRIATGFGFLGREAGLPIAESLIDYSPTNTYLRALLVGLLNTLKVAVVGIILATILGTLIGIARLSKNWLLSKIAGVYVEVIRDLPLLLQLLFWYAILQALPGPRQAARLYVPDLRTLLLVGGAILAGVVAAWLMGRGNTSARARTLVRLGPTLALFLAAWWWQGLLRLVPLEGAFLSNRGLKLPWIQWQDAHSFVLLALVIGAVLAWGLTRRNRAAQLADGQPRRSWPLVLALVLGLPLLTWAGFGAPFTPDLPALRGFNFQGGLTLSPEYFALLIGLVTYTAGFVAEIVRAGILAVPHGQWEAAQALGLRPGAVLRQIVLPQALRVIVPPMTSQYLNITKNSSLAVAIGYQDIVSIANTTLNQTGQAIEGIAVIMLVYLTISLSISAFMNWYNARIALVER